MKLFGKVEKTIVRGQTVYEKGKLTGGMVGSMVLRKRVETKR
jgi:hypothetical protein